eukprot:INCI14558.1.p1 GENE.INCI14558.1~~INCI14558.1.p1  ORF type:complete len:180 (+),score=35.05 INCI14558.1:168-707(+)
MHSAWIRLNAVVFFSISLLGIAAFLSALSTYFHVSHPVVTKFEFNQLRELKPTVNQQRGARDIDRADITFDLECDLSSVFNWNVKQLFVMVTAEYATKSNPFNQVVIWDQIVETPEDAVIRFYNKRNKYLLIDQYDELRGATVTLTLSWDIMPNTGWLYVEEFKDQETSTTFTLPSNYF